jgi:hypothetical protein
MIAPLLSVLTAFALPAAASAAAQLTWSTPSTIDPAQPLSAISCIAGMCVAVDHGGQELASTGPLPTTQSWSTPINIDQGRSLTAVSCPSQTLCVAVDQSGYAVWSTNPSASPSTWLSLDIDHSTPLTGVSCASTTMCVAVDSAGEALVSTNPTATDPVWGTTAIDASAPLAAVSCSAELLCAAVDDTGEILVSTSPTATSPIWRATHIDANTPLAAVSCPQTSLCVAVDSDGKAFASADPGASSPTWSQTEIDPNRSFGALWCGSSSLCVAVDGGGTAFASDNATGAPPSWNESTADPGTTLTAITCLEAGVCEAIDSAGRVLRGLLPAPAVGSATASEVTSSTVTLSASINPNDTVLSDCRFEYSTGGATGLSVPCMSEPAAGGGSQIVLAKLTSLNPASTYIFRVLSANAAGTALGGEASFTTMAIPLPVRPSPTIVGVAGVDQRLYCVAGVPSSAVVSLSYEWLRDARAITGADGSSYKVKSADAKHHLQCRVSATDAGGTLAATSAYVSVPAAGVPASVGETSVGVPSVHASTVSVPVRCSTRASAGCRITLSLYSTQVTKVKRRRVVLASTKVHLNQGQARTITTSLHAAGRHLLAREHRLSISLSVSGTIIGALNATLRTATLTLISNGHSR